MMGTNNTKNHDDHDNNHDNYNNGNTSTGKNEINCENANKNNNARPSLEALAY